VNGRNHQRTGLFILAGIMVLLIFSLIHLLFLRFEAGDVLPAYSTLRADPLGAKVFYESLEKTELVEVSRNFSPMPKIEAGSDTTVFILGLDPRELRWAGSGWDKELDQLVIHGGRLILAMYPTFDLNDGASFQDEEAREETPQKAESKDAQKPPKVEPDEDRAPKAEKADEVPLKTTLLAEHWGFGLEVDKAIGLRRRARVAPGAWEKLPAEVSWNSGLYFTEAKAVWRVVYQAARRPVLMERDYGRGTIVLCGDSYLLSNEGLMKSTEPELLTWLVGGGDHGRRRVIFEETHFGLREDPGVATLARKYRLHGLLAGFLILAGLFIWKNAIPLVPPTPDRGDDGLVVASGRDSAAGLVSLLKRNVPRNRILAVCFNEWKRAALSGSPGLKEKADRAEAEVLSGGAGTVTPVAAYLKIYEILSEGKPWKKARNS
jgi:hypothetical protein